MEIDEMAKGMKFIPACADEFPGGENNSRSSKDTKGDGIVSNLRPFDQVPKKEVACTAYYCGYSLSIEWYNPKITDAVVMAIPVI